MWNSNRSQDNSSINLIFLICIITLYNSKTSFIHDSDVFNSPKLSSYNHQNLSSFYSLRNLFISHLVYKLYTLNFYLLCKHIKSSSLCKSFFSSSKSKGNVSYPASSSYLRLLPSYDYTYRSAYNVWYPYNKASLWVMNLLFLISWPINFILILSRALLKFLVTPWNLTSVGSNFSL